MFISVTILLCVIIKVAAAGAGCLPPPRHSDLLCGRNRSLMCAPSCIRSRGTSGWLAGWTEIERDANAAQNVDSFGHQLKLTLEKSETDRP